MSVFDSPVALTGACLAVTCLAAVLTDPLALPRPVRAAARADHDPRAAPGDLAIRCVVVFLVYAAFFSFTWRPLYAVQATVTFFVVFTVISRLKHHFIREPLIFSDIALVFSLLKDKELYHATWVGALFWIAALGYIIGGTTLYFLFEPTILPETHRWAWIASGVAAAAGPWALALFTPANRPLSRWVLRRLGTLNITRNTARFGTFASVALYLVLWCDVRRYAFMSAKPGKPMRVMKDIYEAPADCRAPLIVVWQSESFFDLRRYGVADLRLPNLDALKRRAAEHGRVTNVFEGGYTLRTEFAVISGVAPEDAHVDASYPYLHAGRYKRVAWPGKLRNAGWRTLFIHPYKRRFFHRHKAMPKLGFERLVMLDDFGHDPVKDGPYVSDAALSERVIGEVRRALAALERDEEANPQEKGGVFAFVASMANHGPWGGGRIAGMSEPIAVYKALLERADAALGDLVRALDAEPRPVWLLFYGDHAPLLKEVADPFPDPRTDFVIVPLGAAAQAAAQANDPASKEPVETAPWRLIETLLHLMAQNR